MPLTDRSSRVLGSVVVLGPEAFRQWCRTPLQWSCLSHCHNAPTSNLEAQSSLLRFIHFGYWRAWPMREESELQGVLLCEDFCLEPVGIPSQGRCPAWSVGVSPHTPVLLSFLSSPTCQVELDCCCLHRRQAWHAVFYRQVMNLVSVW